LKIAQSTDCEGCGQRIGNEDFLLATDGISGKVVAFHKRCNPADPDLQRHYSVSLTPAQFATTLNWGR